jgi:hypothetical protein
LKPAGVIVESGILAADKALDSGSAESLIKEIKQNNSIFKRAGYGYCKSSN